VHDDGDPGARMNFRALVDSTVDAGILERLIQLLHCHLKVGPGVRVSVALMADSSEATRASASQPLRSSPAGRYHL
jgi:hypothetical protein